MCLGDLNSPGNSAKFDSPWGKVLSISNQNLLEDPIRSLTMKEFHSLLIVLEIHGHVFQGKI